MAYHKTNRFFKKHRILPIKNLSFLWIFMVPTVSALEISVVPNQSIFGMSVGESVEVVISVLEENGQPLEGVEVECIEANDPLSVSPTTQTTDNQGKAFFAVSASNVGCGPMLFSVDEDKKSVVIGVVNSKDVEIESIVIEQGSTPPCCPEYDMPIQVLDDQGQSLEGIYVGAASSHVEHTVDSCQITDAEGRATFYMSDVFWNFSQEDYPIVATFAAGDIIETSDIYPIICEVWLDVDKESLALTVGEEDSITVHTQTPCVGDVDVEVCLNYNDEFIYVRPSRCQNSGSDARATFNILGLKSGETSFDIEYGLGFPIGVTIETTDRAFASGKVSNSTTDEAIEGAEVKIGGVGVTALMSTRQDGSYVVELRSGLNSLIATSDDYHTTTWTGQAKPGEVTIVNFPLNPDDGFTSTTGTFSGEIKDTVTGGPITGDDGLFFLLPNGMFVENKGDGIFKEDGLNTGAYLAVLLKWGYWPWFYLFQLEGGETEMFTIDLMPLLYDN